VWLHEWSGVTRQELAFAALISPEVRWELEALTEPPLVVDAAEEFVINPFITIGK
jgi:hypothetical protein